MRGVPGRGGGATFKWAVEAEKTHVRLFDEALAFVELKPDSWGVGSGGQFMCGPVCGHTAEEQQARCAGFATVPGRGFEMVR